MNACPACGHDNLQSAPSCIKCGTTLGAGLGGMGGGGLGAGDAEYQALLRKQAAAKKAKQKVTFIVLVVAVAGIGFVMWKDRKHKAVVQAKLDFVESWVAIDRKEGGAFWNCVTQSTAQVDQFSSGDQVSAKMEMAFMTQPKTFPQFLRDDCVHKAERAEDEVRSLSEIPDEFAEGIKQYQSSVAALRAGLIDYADRLEKRGTVKSADDLIQEYGMAWHSEYKPTPATIAFDKFLNCAIPDLQKIKDVQGLLEFLADQCYKQDPVAFMTGVRDKCGAILTSLDGTAKPSGTYKASLKKFFEDEQRMIQAWGDCSRKSAKGGKSDDLTQFLHAMGEYMQSRATIAKAGKEVQESI